MSVTWEGSVASRTYIVKCLVSLMPKGVSSYLFVYRHHAPDVPRGDKNQTPCPHKFGVRSRAHRALLNRERSGIVDELEHHYDPVTGTIAARKFAPTASVGVEIRRDVSPQIREHIRFWFVLEPIDNSEDFQHQIR